MKELNKNQTKEYFEKVTRKCINIWELYNAHMYVVSTVLQFLIRDDMGYREFDEEEAINETGAVDVARGMYNDPDICADEETKKLLKHIFKYLIFENPDLCTMETAIAVCSCVLSL